MTRRQKREGDGNSGVVRFFPVRAFFWGMVWAAVVVAPQAAGQDVVLNEVLSRNASTLADEDGDFSDWIEIFNTSGRMIDLSGYGLSDDPDEPLKWLFPSLSLAPGGFAVVFASGKDRPGSSGSQSAGTPVLRPHTNFRLDADGETLLLATPDGQVADSVGFSEMPIDVSYGRLPGSPSTWVFFSQPTPGSRNASAGFGQVAPAPAFSVTGGRYEQDVFLNLDAGDPGVFVHYSLDGSVPAPTSPRYTGEISLTRTAVVRARAFGPDRMPGPVITHTYLIREDRYLPAVSVTTEPDNLWDWQTGIYVLGPNAQTANPHFGANFWQDWEIPVHVELIETDGTRAFGFDAGSKIAGQWSRAHPQKSMAIYARSRYGASSIEYPLFPDRPTTSYEGFMLRNSGNDWNRTHLRDAYMQRLVDHTAIDVQAYRPVVLYLNGAYWGILNLREKVNEHYAASLDNAAVEDVDLIEGMAPPALKALYGSDADYRALIDFVSTDNMTSDAALEEVRWRLDLDNFIDYQIAEIFFDNRDWPGNNVKIRRNREGDGLWRWILYDTDFGFGIWNRNAYTENTLAFATAGDGPDWPNPPWSTLLLRRLLRNATFRRDFANRFADFLNVHFKEERMLAVLEEMRAAIAPEMPRHKQRWGGSVREWEDALEVMRAFARGRRAPMVSHLRDYFGLFGAGPVTLRVEPEGAGTIRIHRERIRTFPWTGTYFRGLPVTVTALPAPGYRFAGWAESPEYTDRSITIDPATSPSWTARFVPDTAHAERVVFNEIMYRSSPDLDSGDWVELLNRSDTEVDVSEWAFRDEQDEHEFRLPPGTSIPPGGQVVLCRTERRFTQVYPDAGGCIGDWEFGLSGQGERIRLYDAQGVAVDSLEYGVDSPWPSEPNGGGPSLELADAQADNADPSAWRASTVAGGTPGAPNSLAVPAEADSPMPTVFGLEAPYPNPFSRHASFVFRMLHDGQLSLQVYDVLGRPVVRLMDERRPAGEGVVVWDAETLPPGVYVVAMAVDGEWKATRRAVLVR